MDHLLKDDLMVLEQVESDSVIHLPISMRTLFPTSKHVDLYHLESDLIPDS